MPQQSRKCASAQQSTTTFLDGLNTIPLYLVPWRYRHILFTAVLCGALMLCVNWAHWWTAKDISGLVFDTRYNIILITEAYGLGKSLLASYPLASVPRVTSTMVGVVNPLQWSIPMASKTLRINPVWQNWNQSSSNVLISIHNNLDTDYPFECS